MYVVYKVCVCVGCIMQMLGACVHSYTESSSTKFTRLDIIHILKNTNCMTPYHLWCILFLFQFKFTLNITVWLSTLSGLESGGTAVVWRRALSVTFGTHLPPWCACTRHHCPLRSMGCHHVPQNRSGEVMTTYINTVDSDVQTIQKQTHTHTNINESVAED